MDSLDSRDSNAANEWEWIIDAIKEPKCWIDAKKADLKRRPRIRILVRVQIHLLNSIAKTRFPFEQSSSSEGKEISFSDSLFSYFVFRMEIKTQIQVKNISQMWGLKAARWVK